MLSFLSFAQENDSLWNFDDLEPIIEEPITTETGKGFFPGLPSKSKSFGFTLNATSIFTFAENLRSDNFANPSYFFGVNEPDDFTQRFEQSDRWSENTNSNNLSRNGIVLGVDFINNFSLPFYFDLGIYFEFRSDYLLSNLGEKPFLINESEIEYFEEYSVIDLWEYSIFGSVGVKIPIYGGFIKINQKDVISQSVGSFYFLDLSFVPEIVLRSRADQYNIITTQKDRIRYQSGHDTLNFAEAEQIPGVNLRRNYLQIGFSSLNYFSNFGFEYGLNYRFPLSGVLENTDWNQHILSITVKLRYSI